jgi:adenosine kinase
MTMNIAVFGSLAYDYIMHFSGTFTDRIKEEKLSSLSLSFLVDSLTKQLGGTAGNIAYSLNLLDTPAHILAYAGNDFDTYQTHLQHHSISTTYIRTDKKLPTSSYFVITDKTGNQIGSFYIGAMKHASTLTLKTMTPAPDFVVVAPADPKAMLHIAKEAAERGIPYLFDPAFQTATFSQEELRTAITSCDMLIGNEYEISLIEDALSVSHEELLLMVPRMITTLGEKGSIVEDRTTAIHIPAIPVKKAVDPTGAGDAYRAGFLAGYVRGYTSVVCGQLGTIAAAYTVECSGTQTHTYTKKEFTERYRKHFGENIQL